MSKSVLLYQCFVGVDLHKTSVTLVAVTTDGKMIARLTVNTKCRHKIIAWLDALPHPLHLVVEAVGFVEWFIDEFRHRVDHIDLADAAELSNRRGHRRKNDWRDALDMAQRLARGECPLAYIADDDLMQLRKLGRHWRRLIRKTGGIAAKANTAMGRRLLRLLYAMVRDNKPYQPGTPRNRTAAANKARAKRKARKEAA
jgi:hypothetical protein